MKNCVPNHIEIRKKSIFEKWMNYRINRLLEQFNGLKVSKTCNVNWIIFKSSC